MLRQLRQLQDTQRAVREAVVFGKSQFSMGKLTISMAIFNSKLLNYQRVYVIF